MDEVINKLFSADVGLTCVDVHLSAGVDHAVRGQVVSHSVVLGKTHRDVSIWTTLRVENNTWENEYYKV